MILKESQGCNFFGPKIVSENNNDSLLTQADLKLFILMQLGQNWQLI